MGNEENILVYRWKVKQKEDMAAVTHIEKQSFSRTQLSLLVLVNKDILLR